MADDIVIRACNVFDIPIADAVIRHPEVYRMYPIDDMPEDSERYSCARAVIDSPPTYVLMDDTNRFVAIINNLTTSMWCGHYYAHPSVRGRQSVQIGKAMIRWMFDNTPCRKLIGFTPSEHERAMSFNLKCGFKKEYEIENAYVSNGESKNAHMVSISKEK